MVNTSGKREEDELVLLDENLLKCKLQIKNILNVLCIKF